MKFGPRILMIQSIDGYKRHVSPLLGTRCRFYPSCSEYAHHVLNSDVPLFRALQRIVFRLLRCQPFHPGGVDLP